MKRITAAILIIMIFVPGSLFAEILGNPGFQVGKKNLFIGLEYSSIMHIYDIDTNGLDTFSERVSLKVTTGLADWLDIYIKGGGASLKLDYEKESNALKNFDSNMSVGFGAGARLRLLNFVDSGTRVFLQGGGFFFKADGDFQKQIDSYTIRTTDREIKWADIYAGLGIAKRMDFIDLHIGVGFSEIYWDYKDVIVDRTGTATSKLPGSERSSFESRSPIFGFIGLDFVLPYEYRISAQAGIRNIDEVEFNIAISQGLERD